MVLCQPGITADGWFLPERSKQVSTLIFVSTLLVVSYLVYELFFVDPAKVTTRRKLRNGVIGLTYAVGAFLGINAVSHGHVESFQSGLWWFMLSALSLFVLCGIVALSFLHLAGASRDNKKRTQAE